MWEVCKSITTGAWAVTMALIRLLMHKVVWYIGIWLGWHSRIPLTETSLFIGVEAEFRIAWVHNPSGSKWNQEST